MEHRLNEDEIPESLRNNPQAKRFFRFVREDVTLQPATLCVLEHHQEVIVPEAETAETWTCAVATVTPMLLVDFGSNIDLPQSAHWLAMQQTTAVDPQQLTQCGGIATIGLLLLSIKTR